MFFAVLGITYFDFFVAMFKQNMQFFSTESDENQHRKEKSACIKSDISWMISQYLIFRTIFTDTFNRQFDVLNFKTFGQRRNRND